MEQYIPFTYLIKFKKTGELYYGSRTAKACHPSELGTIYTSSSEDLKALINKHGIDQFDFEVRQTFKTKKECLAWEHRFLKRVDAARNPIFINAHNGGRDFVGRPWSEERKRAHSEKMKGKRICEEVTPEMKEASKKTRLVKNNGSYHSQESINKMKANFNSPGHTGRRFSPEHIANLSASKTGVKRAPWTDEQKATRSAAMLGIKRGPYKVNTLTSKR